MTLTIFSGEYPLNRPIQHDSIAVRFKHDPTSHAATMELEVSDAAGPRLRFHLSYTDWHQLLNRVTNTARQHPTLSLAEQLPWLR